MKILVISQTVWSNENNSGNTLSNLFNSVEAEFAHIYCSGGVPTSKVCSNFFQITDRMIIEHLVKQKTIGRSFTLKFGQAEDKTFETMSKKYRNSFTKILRDIAWLICKYDSSEMYQFIFDFEPDIIYAPCFGNLRMNKLIQRVNSKVKVPVVAYISDDIYSCKSNSNVVERIYQHFLRKSIKRSFQIYDKIYTMTEKQQQEYANIFNKPMNILRKSAIQLPNKREIHNPVRLIYAGGLYLGRAEVLKLIINAIDQLREKFEVVLDVYSDNCDLLPSRNYLRMNGLIQYTDLLDVYRNSDIAIHVESFDKKNMELTRLSFSTKIVDCLQSGCAMLAICPSENAGYDFLMKEDAALCVSDIDNCDLKQSLIDLIEQFREYQEKARQCVENNFSADANKIKIEADFYEVIERYKK